jgi:hypothetical protein
VPMEWETTVARARPKASKTASASSAWRATVMSSPTGERPGSAEVDAYDAIRRGQLLGLDLEHRRRTSESVQHEHSGASATVLEGQPVAADVQQPGDHCGSSGAPAPDGLVGVKELHRLPTASAPNVMLEPADFQDARDLTACEVPCAFSASAPSSPRFSDYYKICPCSRPAWLRFVVQCKIIL